MRVAGLGFRQGADVTSLAAALAAALEAALSAAPENALWAAGQTSAAGAAPARPTAPTLPGAQAHAPRRQEPPERSPGIAPPTSPVRLDALATSARKAADPAAQALARRLGLPLLVVSDDVLATQTTPTDSPRVRAHTGTGSLAEAAALAAAGRQGRLLGPRAVSPDGCATAAIAAGPTTTVTATFTTTGSAASAATAQAAATATAVATAITAATPAARPVTTDPGPTAGAPAASPTPAPAIPSLPEHP